MVKCVPRILKDGLDSITSPEEACRNKIHVSRKESLQDT